MRLLLAALLLFTICDRHVYAGGPLGVVYGGSGLSTLVAGAIPVGNGISPPTFLSPVNGDIMFGIGGAWTVSPLSAALGWCNLVSDGGAVPGSSDSLPAFLFCEATGLPIWVPSSANGLPTTYTVSGSIPLNSYSDIVGPASQLVTIREAAGTCATPIVGANAYSLFGTNSTGGIHDWHLRGLTIDGNSVNQPGCTTEDGIAQYGYHFRVEDVYVQNTPRYGIWSEWYEYGDFSMEAQLYGLTTDTTGQDGVHWGGPHDSGLYDLRTIDAGQSADNTYVGLNVYGYGNSNFYGFHGWHRSTVTNRVAYQAQSVGGNSFTQSQFEGGRQQFHEASAGANDLCENCKFFAPEGAAASSLIVNDSGQPHLVLSGPNASLICTGGAGNQTYAWSLNSNASHDVCFASLGSGASDLQSDRFTTGAGAYGTDAFAAGGNNSVNNYGLGYGYNNSASGSYSMVGGRETTDNGRYAARCYSGYGANVVTEGQSCEQQLFAKTTSTAAARLTANGGAGSGSNEVNLAVDNTVYHLTIELVALDQTVGTSRSYTATALIQRKTGVASVAFIGSPAFTSDFGSLTIGTPPALLADTVNGGLDISVTPPSGDTIDWIATVRSAEIR